MQKILTLLITAGILYMIMQHKIESWDNPIKKSAETILENNNNDQNDNPNSSNSNNKPQGGFIEKTLSKVLTNVLKSDEGRSFMEHLITPIDKPLDGNNIGFKVNNDNIINSILNIKTLGEGEGGIATCGNMVKVSHKIFSYNGILVSEKTESFPLGSNIAVPGIDAVVVGMKIGQTRHALIPLKYFNNKVKSSSGSSVYKLNVDLLDIIPKTSIADEVKIFDDQIAYSMPLFCGQKIAFDAKIVNLSNSEVVYDSTKSGQKLITTIGNLVDPMVVSYALHNKIPLGTRTVIAQGKWFKSYLSDDSRFFPNKPLPTNQYFMLDLSNFENLDNNYSNQPK